MSHRLTQNSPEPWLKSFPFPKIENHKYDRGHALIYGGPMTGAARMAGRAAQRIGAGLVTLAAAKADYPIYAEALESIIVHVADDLSDWKKLLNDPKKSAVLIGPGLGPRPWQRFTANGLCACGVGQWQGLRAGRRCADKF